MNKIRLFIAAALLAVLFGCLNTLLVLKLGMAAPIMSTAPILGYFILMLLMRKYKTGDNMFLLSVSSGASFSFFTLDALLAAVLIFSGANEDLIIQPALLIIFSLAAALTGVVIVLSSQKLWMNEEKHIFPYAKISATLIQSFANSAESEEKSPGILPVSFCVSSLITVIMRIFPFLGNFFTGKGISYLTSFIGIELSPMLFGMGMIIGEKSAVFMLLGSLYSIIIWILFEKADAAVTFFNHVTQPYILSLGISLIITGVFVSFGDMLVKVIKNSKKKLTAATLKKNENSFNLRLLVLPAVMLLISACLFFYLNHKILSINFILILFVLFLTLICVVIVSKISAEIGLVSASSIIYISLIFLSFFTKDLTTIMFLAGFAGVASFSGSSMLNILKTSSLLGLDNKSAIRGQIMGILIGCFACSVFLISLYKVYNFNTEILPVPASISWGIIAKGLSSGIFSNYFNVYIFLSGVILSIILYRLKVSSSIVGIAILLPPSTSACIFLGGMFLFVIKGLNKRKPNRLLKYSQHLSSGLIAGEGVVALFFIFIKLIFS